MFIMSINSLNSYEVKCLTYNIKYQFNMEISVCRKLCFTSYLNTTFVLETHQTTEAEERI